MTRARRALRSPRPSPTQLFTAAQARVAAHTSSVDDALRRARAVVSERIRSGHPRKDLIRTGVAALTITALGLGAAGAMTATSSATGVSSPAATTSAPVATAPAFDRREAGTSRDSRREAISAAERKRASELAQVREKVSKAQRDAAIDKRAKQLAGASVTTSKTARAMEEKKAAKVMPLSTYRIAAQFGAVGAWARYHTGIDFSAPLGTPIRSVAAGVVTHAGSGGEAGGWAGSYVVVLHEDGYSTLYAHMNPGLGVSVGQEVGPETLLGHVGLTGRTFGAHCHVELYPPGATPGDV